MAECRRLVQDYLETERQADLAGEAGLGDAPQTPLFVSTVRDARNPQGFLRRQQVNRMLVRIAAQAAALSPKQGAIAVHPHRLRHAFGAQHREKSGSDSETAAALGHTGLQYVGRYVRKTDTERDELLEAMFDA